MLFINSPYCRNINSKKTDTTHMSLGFVAKRFNKLALKSGLKTRQINLPDIYKSLIAYKYSFGNKSYNLDDINYLCVSSWDNAHILSSAKKKIFHLSWEQPEISNPGYIKNFGQNMCETLSKFDRIWSCAKFVNDSATLYGLSSTMLPTPIKYNVSTNQAIDFINFINSINEYIFSPYFYYTDGHFVLNVADSISENSGKKLIYKLYQKLNNQKINIFITQGNMGDARKNLFETMMGFSLFANNDANSILIVKTSYSSKWNILNELGPNIESSIRWGWWGSQNIFIIPYYFPDNIQDIFYSIADYYLCCPISEGQNIPLQEAIQSGCYAITPIHSAMEEYLEDDLVAKIESSKIELDPKLYCNAPLTKYYGNISTLINIADACQNAVDTKEQDKKEKIKIIQDKYLYYYTYSYLKNKFLEELA